MMKIDISDVRIDFDFGLRCDVVEYESGLQQDRYERCLIRIRDSSADKLKELTISMPVQYARSIASEILELSVADACQDEVNSQRPSS